MSYQRASINSKDRKDLLSQAQTLVSDIEDLFHKKTDLFTIEGKNGKAIIYQEKVAFILTKNLLIPSLHLLRQKTSLLPKIIVDIGAIKFVANGADIMRPGIVHADSNVQEGGLVLIVEEKNRAHLAVGQAVYDAVDLLAMTSGKVVRNLHHLKDEWWVYPAQPS